jgi:hypothetical protein
MAYHQEEEEEEEEGGENKMMAICGRASNGRDAVWPWSW